MVPNSPNMPSQGQSQNRSNAPSFKQTSKVPGTMPAEKRFAFDRFDKFILSLENLDDATKQVINRSSSSSSTSTTSNPFLGQKRANSGSSTSFHNDKDFAPKSPDNGSRFAKIGDSVKLHSRSLMRPRNLVIVGFIATAAALAYFIPYRKDGMKLEYAKKADFKDLFDELNR